MDSVFAADRGRTDESTSGSTSGATTTTTATPPSSVPPEHAGLRALRMRTVHLESALGYQVYTASVLARELESCKMHVTTLETENAYLRERLAELLHAPTRARHAGDGSTKRRRHDDLGSVDSQTELDVAMLLGSLSSVPMPMPMPMPPTPPLPPPLPHASTRTTAEPTTPIRCVSASASVQLGTPPRSASSKPVYLMRPLPLSGTPTARMLVTPMSLPLTLPLPPAPPMPPIPSTLTFGDTPA